MNQSLDRVKWTRLWSCCALGSSASLDPLPLADSSLKVWSDSRNLLARSHHGTSHLVAVGIHYITIIFKLKSCRHLEDSQALCKNIVLPANTLL